MQLIEANYWYVSNYFNIQEKQPYVVDLSNGLRYIRVQAHFLFIDIGILVILDSEIRDDAIPLSGGYLKMGLETSQFIIGPNDVIEIFLKYQKERARLSSKQLYNYTIT